MLVVFRLLATCRCPASTATRSRSSSQDNPLFGLLNLFSGGGLSNFSIIALGVNPYINASIIMQLMTGVVPPLQQLSAKASTGATRSTSTPAT